MKNTFKAKYLTYIHHLRGLAILFIVGVHTRLQPENWLDNEFTYNVFVSLLDNGTLLFIFIGGFLFQHIHQQHFNYLQYMNRKLKYVMLPYLIISIPAIIVRMYTDYQAPFFPEGFLGKSYFYKVIYYVSTGAHLLPLWFMPMIFIFYLISPLLKKLDHNIFYKYFFPIFFCIGLFTYRPFLNGNPLLAFFHFLPIYIFGMAISRYKNRIVSLKFKLILPLLAVYLAFIFMELSNIIIINKNMTFERVLYDHEFILNVDQMKLSILSIILLNAFYLLRNKSMPLLQFLGTYSFGIYFLHQYFIGLLEDFVFGGKISFNFLYYLLFTGVIILFSILSIRVIQRFAGNNSRMIIGT